MREHMEVPIIATVFYLVMVFGIKHLMKDRKPFDLKYPLVLWNMSLAIFSMIGAYYTTDAMVRSVLRVGFKEDMCTIDSEYENPWVYLFCLSKIPEFIDTLFIVLRKGHLPFLHWYHHLATMWYCWVAWATRVENGGGFAMMNLIVHSFMYTYYAANGLKMSWTLYFKKSITTIQIVQMLLGMFVVCHNIVYCNTHPFELYSGFVMYLSYAILFVDLYYKNYILMLEKKSSRDDTKGSDKKENVNGKNESNGKETNGKKEKSGKENTNEKKEVR